jgi:hypothetical protein
LKERKGKKEEMKKPWWQRRIERSIVDWRKDLGRVEMIRRGVDIRKKDRETLDKKYGLLENGALSACTFRKSKIHGGSTKVRCYLDKVFRLRQNNLFKNNQSQLYKKLNGISRNGNNTQPNAAESKEFWSKIWSVEKEHDRDASWLGTVRRTWMELGSRKEL